MNRLRPRIILGFLLLFPWLPHVPAAPSALIVVGLTANETDATRWSSLAAKTRAALAVRGIPAARITVLTSADGAPVTRDRILAAAKETAIGVNPTDDCWFVFFGHSAPARDDQPAFQVRGPRLTATDLQTALAAIPGHTFAVLNTSQSGGYLPFLKTLPRCTALAATAEAGETGVPRFPENWVDALVENPAAPFATLAALASERVDAFYKNGNLAQVESARLLVGPAREILTAPFGVTDTAAPTADTANNPAPASALTAADIDIPVSTEEAEFSAAPATDATRVLLADAAKLAPQAAGYSALVLHQDIALTLNSDRTTTRSTRLRVLLLTPAAVSEWADYTFVHQPPTETTRIEGARLILPDASALVLNPRRLSEQSPASSEVPVPLHVSLPQAAPGCIVEIAWTTELRAAYDLPEFYDELELSRSAPVVATVLTLRAPKTRTYAQLRNLPGDPLPVESETEHSRVMTWTLAALPAYEPLPYDPPRRDLVPALAVSSLPTWAEFDTWFRRISKGSDAIGPGVRARAAEIARLNPTPEARLRAAYGFVSSLRYIAIEFGIHAFRPRTPDTVLQNRYGDCKDKANLLIALLHAMDIPAEFVLLNRGSSTNPDFPGWQFNHAIAHVPAFAGQPERWLDTTDGTTRFGLIAPGDLGRQARIIPATGEARFAVVGLGTETTTVTDTWTFETHVHGAWLGRVERRLTGLADYELRQKLANASPALRTFALQQQLGALLPDATFENLTFGNLDDLGQPVVITATFALFADSPAPRPSPGLAAALAAPTRDRPIELNDGQPLRYTQIVRRVTTGAETAPALEDNAPHAPMRVGENTFSQSFSRPDDHTVINTAILDLKSPVVSSADYPSLVQTFRMWRELAAIPVDHHPFSKP